MATKKANDDFDLLNKSSGSTTATPSSDSENTTGGGFWSSVSSAASFVKEAASSFVGKIGSMMGLGTNSGEASEVEKKETSSASSTSGGGFWKTLTDAANSVMNSITSFIKDMFKPSSSSQDISWSSLGDTRSHASVQQVKNPDTVYNVNFRSGSDAMNAYIELIQKRKGQEGVAEDMQDARKGILRFRPGDNHAAFFDQLANSRMTFIANKIEGPPQEPDCVVAPGYNQAIYRGNQENVVAHLSADRSYDSRMTPSYDAVIRDLGGSPPSSSPDQFNP